MKKLDKKQATILEIANELIKTLGNMPSSEADSIVRAQAEKLLNEVAGIKGSIRGSFSCILFKNGEGKNSTSYKFVEE